MTPDDAIRVAFLPTMRVGGGVEPLLKSTMSVRIWPEAARSNAKPHITLVADDGFLDALDQLRMWHELGRPSYRDALAQEGAS